MAASLFSHQQNGCGSPTVNDTQALLDHVSEALNVQAVTQVEPVIGQIFRNDRIPNPRTRPRRSNGSLAKLTSEAPAGLFPEYREQLSMNGMSKVIASSLSQFQFYQIPHKYSLRMDSQFMENAYEAGRLPGIL